MKGRFHANSVFAGHIKKRHIIRQLCRTSALYQSCDIWATKRQMQGSGTQ